MTLYQWLAFDNGIVDWFSAGWLRLRYLWFLMRVSYFWWAYRWLVLSVNLEGLFEVVRIIHIVYVIINNSCWLLDRMRLKAHLRRRLYPLLWTLGLNHLHGWHHRLFSWLDWFFEIWSWSYGRHICHWLCHWFTIFIINVLIHLRFILVVVFNELFFSRLPDLRVRSVLEFIFLGI